MNKMKKYIIPFLAITCSVSVLLMNSCSKSEFEPYDHPFIHIHVNNSDTATVKYDRKDTVDYVVYLSAKLQFDPIDVEYEIIKGDGLEEGRDYSVINTGRTLHFEPGMFERAVRIAWLSKEVDGSKNNSLIIKLVSNTKNYTLGLPGPDKKQQQLKLIKVK